MSKNRQASLLNEVLSRRGREDIDKNKMINDNDNILNTKTLNFMYVLFFAIYKLNNTQYSSQFKSIVYLEPLPSTDPHYIKLEKGSLS